MCVFVYVYACVCVCDHVFTSPRPIKCDPSKKNRNTMPFVANQQWRHLYVQTLVKDIFDSAWPMVRVSCQPVSAWSSGRLFFLQFCYPQIWTKGIAPKSTKNSSPADEQCGQLSIKIKNKCTYVYRQIIILFIFDYLFTLSLELNTILFFLVWPSSRMQRKVA